MNLANKLTLVRIFLIPVFMVFLLVKFFPYGGKFIAAGVFTLAALTDGLDGYIARKNNQVTRVGKFLDPLADKLLISAALISLVGLGKLHAGIAFIIIAREFIITGLRVMVAGERKILVASKLGKAKTIFQIVAVLYIIIISDLENLSAILPPLSDFLQKFPYLYLNWFLLFLAVLFTVWSGVDYMYKNKWVFKMGKE